MAKKEKLKPIIKGKSENDIQKGITNKAMKKLIEEIELKKEKIIFDSLKKLNIELDIELEQKRRFKSLTVVTDGNKQTIYYNDGSVDGVKVVTMETSTPTFDEKSKKVNYDIKFY